MTHSERPWREARGNLPVGEPSHEVIPAGVLQDYFGALFADVPD